MATFLSAGEMLVAYSKALAMVAGLTAQNRRLRTIARQAANGWACYATRKREYDEIARLHEAIDAEERANALTT